MKYFLLIVMACILFPAQAQELPPSTQQQYEETAAGQDDVPEDDQLQQLEYLKKHPVSLNGGSVEILVQLQLINPVQLQQLVAYLKWAGPLIDIKELQAVPAFDPAAIRKILPYISIEREVSLRDNLSARLKGEQSILLRLSRATGKGSGHEEYAGDPHHILFRYRYQFRDLAYFGITGEKDAGESFFRGAEKKGFDFYSAHLFLRRWGPVETLALGDFTVNMGQGLMQWQSFGPGKTSDILSIKRSAPVLQPYRASGEFNFFRGIGLTLRRKRLETSLFVSLKRISGRREDSVLSSIKTDGYFRNATELAARNQARLFSAGGNAGYHNERFHAAVNGIFHQLDAALQPPNEPYRYFSFKGKRMVAVGADISYTFRNIHVFGEAVAGMDKSHALLAAMIFSADPKVDLSLLFRGLSKNYFTLFGSAFTENSQNGNERGLFAGITLHPSAGWNLNAYMDFFHFPWLRFRVSAPSSGQDFLVQLDRKFDRRTSLLIRYRQRNRAINDTAAPLHGLLPYTSKDLRLQFSRESSTHQSLSARLEVLRIIKEGRREEGYLSYIEGSVRLLQNMQVQLRLQYFETGSYDSRIYAYESDVLYGFSIPAFYDEGFRYYLNCRLKAGRSLTVWLRWAQTVYGGQNPPGNAGVNPTKNQEIRFQGVISL